MTNILDIAKEVADLSATKRPNDLFSGNRDDSIFLSVAKATLDSLMRYDNWADLIREGFFITVEGKKNYDLKCILPDFYCLLNNTVYIKDSSEKIIGSITPEEFQENRYFEVGDYKFIIANGFIRFLSDIPSGVRIEFFYRANSTCYDAQTEEEKPTITENTDIPIFDPYLVKLGMLYRYNKRNGFDYSEEKNEYDREVEKAFADSKASGNIHLAGRFFDIVEEECINVISK